MDIFILEKNYSWKSYSYEKLKKIWKEIYQILKLYNVFCITKILTLF